MLNLPAANVMPIPAMRIYFFSLKANSFKPVQIIAAKRKISPRILVALQALNHPVQENKYLHF